MNKKQKIIDIANRLNIPPQWLSALIHFETAGTYDPNIKNPNSSARGLIQVTDRTARDVFNATDSLSLSMTYPDFNSYMDNVVFPYLEKYTPFPTLDSLCMAVFYPAYRDKGPQTEFPQWVRDVNPGINTVGDYTALVKKRLGRWPPSGPVTVATIAGIAAVVYLITRRL